jgi:ribosome assembly protein YihI (activator of Der GTPase)
MASTEAISRRGDIGRSSQCHSSRATFSTPHATTSSRSVSKLDDPSHSASSSRIGLSRLFSLRKKQAHVHPNDQHAVANDRLDDRRDAAPSPSILVITPPSDPAEASVGIPFPSGSKATSQGSSLDRSQSLLSRSMPSNSHFKLRRPRQQSLYASDQSGSALQSRESLQEPNSVLQNLDLNKSFSPSFPSFIRKGSRHSRSRTEAFIGTDTAKVSERQPEGRPRKLSLSGLNFFKTYPRPPTTPEIEAWKEKRTAADHVEAANLHHIHDHMKRNTAETRIYPHTTGLGLSPEADKGGPTFVSGLSALPEGWLSRESERSSSSSKRKPVPPLDLSLIAGADSTLDSPLPSFHDNNRPYSLISTDTEGCDTPIVRLRRLVVDTKESEEDQDAQNQLFFRPIPAHNESLESASQEAEILQDEEIEGAIQSVAGLHTTEASGPSSGSSTLNARLFSKQMALQDGSKIIEPTRALPIPSFYPDLEGDNQLQYQQRQPPRFVPLAVDIPSSPFAVSGPASNSLSARPSSENKRESAVSSRTETSVLEAVLSRATSTRLHTVPLRRIRVEEWAQQLAQSEQPDEATAEANVVASSGDVQSIPDIPDEAASSRDDLPSGPVIDDSGEGRNTSLEGRAVVDQHSSSNLSEAARLGTSPSKRSRTQRIDGEAKDTDARQLTMGDLLKEGAVLSQEDKKEKKSRDGHTGERRSRREEGSSKKEKHRRGDSRISSAKKTYLTSEEAAIAKRKEQDEKEARRKERRLKKELERQEAYAEKKRNDPLLQMRLALVGLSTAGEARHVEGYTQEGPRPVVESFDSAMVLSKASFHTAPEDKEDMEVEIIPIDMTPSEPLQQHRRNQNSTSSSKTIHGIDIGDSQLATPKAIARKAPRMNDNSTVFVDGQEVHLSRGASLRDYPASVKRLAFISEQNLHDRDRMAHPRQSFVPEVFDRFSLQSFVN